MQKYVPGHAINRLLRIIGREVFFLLDNGYITADQLDLAVKASIAPRMCTLGVVQRYDFTGLDLSAGNLRLANYPEPPLDNAPKSLVQPGGDGPFGSQDRLGILRLFRQTAGRDAGQARRRSDPGAEGNRVRAQESSQAGVSAEHEIKPAK